MDEKERRLSDENLALFARLQLPPQFQGGRHVQIPPELAAMLLRSLQLCWDRGERSGSPGGLHVVHGGREHVFWGCETYDKVQAPLIRDVQRKYTTMIPVHELEETSWQQLLHTGLPGLQEVISHAKAQADNMTLLACHILRQDSLQACFSWHQDNRNNPFTRLSMVFLLSEAASTMRIAGFEPFRYASQGDGCAFPSEAHHCSGGSSPGTVKITFFFGDATPSAALLVARQARGEW